MTNVTPGKLIVLPGLSDGLAVVKGKARILSFPFRSFFRDYTVYVFSRKNAMPEGYTVRDMASDQVRAMKDLDIWPAYVMGVSQGGMIAQYIAIDHPEMVTKLILAVSAPYANPVIQNAVTGWIDMAEHGDYSTLMADTAEKMYSGRYLQKHRKAISLFARFTKPRDFDRFIINARAILGFDARSDLGMIDCPVLILAGSDDHTVGSDAAGELNRAITGSELFVYPGLGHGAFEEAKDFYSKVLDFCNR